MIDIDKVKGIIIEPDGIAHSFGHCLMIPKEIEITHERHEKCFEEEILTSNWWKDNKVNYDYNQYYYSQLGNLTKQGFSLIQNNSCVTNRGNRSITYVIALSSEALSNQEEYIKSVYPKISEIITGEESAYFELSLFRDGLPIIDMLGDTVEKLDEFYKELGIVPEKSDETSKIK